MYDLRSIFLCGDTLTGIVIKIPRFIGSPVI